MQQELREAIQHHQAGRLQMAESGYRKILAANPDHADGLHLFGLLAYQVGRPDLAIELIGKAIQNNPRVPQYHDHIGSAYLALERFNEAVSCFERALALKPDFAGACNNLANALRALNRREEAAIYYRKAIKLMPDMAEAYNNLGNLLHEAGETERALPIIRMAIELKPDNPETHHTMGIVLHDSGKTDEALLHYRKAIELKPDYPEAYNNMGILLHDKGKIDEAICCYGQAIDLKPDYPEAYNNLGNSLRSRGRLEEAIAMLRKGVELIPDSAEAHHNLGAVLRDGGKAEEAILHYSKAVELKEDYPEAHNGLGSLLHALGKAEEAVLCYRRAIELKPDYPEAYNNLGVALLERGEPDEAILHYRKALRAKPGYADAHSNYLMALHYDRNLDRESLYREALEWGRMYCHSPNLDSSFNNPPVPGRRLRIGYVSADFRRHPVGYFIQAVLANHDRSGYEIFCYSNRHEADDLTMKLRSMDVCWRSIAGLSDEEAEEMIRRDGIDILIDLSGHSAGNRLLLFSRRPAPVQASWIGYFDTTAVPPMDYIIADPHVMPEADERFYTEKPARLPHSYLCYTPHSYAPEVTELPCQRRGHVTFGCFNNVSKVNREVIEGWSRILRAVPGSRLCFKSPALNSSFLRNRFRNMFHENSIEEGRVDLVESSSHRDYLAYYGNIDIVLETFPFTGNTTTADSLWMGVPVPTLVCEGFTGRFGLTILTAFGLNDLIAYDLDEYVAIVAGLAGDIRRLTALRSTLRRKMESSTLCDGKAFARDMEGLYRHMWTAWCEKRK